MSAKYVVAAYDRCGEFDSWDCGGDFAGALAKLVEWRAHYKGKVVQLANVDAVDLGCADGLTEEEREAALEASHAVIYKRVRHAAHYGNGGGHDLEEWSYQQSERLPVPAGVGRGAEYHSGYLDVGGAQRWVYVRRAPLGEGYCANCKPVDLVGMAKTILGVRS